MIDGKSGHDCRLYSSEEKLYHKLGVSPLTHLIKKSPSLRVTEHMQPPTAVVAAGPSCGCEVSQDSVVLCVIVHHSIEALTAQVTTPTSTHCLPT